MTVDTETTEAVLVDEVAALHEEIRLAHLKLKGIQEIGQILAREHNLDRVLAEIIKRTTALMDADRSTLFLLADDSQTMSSKSTHGGEIKTIELDVGQGIAGWVARHGRTVNVKDAYKDARFDAEVDRASGYRTRSILCQPLRDSKQRTLGVIQVLNKGDGYFTTADEQLLSAIAGQAAVCIHNSRLYLDVVTKNIDLLDTQLRLEERTKEVELMFRVERAAATARSMDGALGGALLCALEEYPCHGVGVMLYDAKREGFGTQLVLGDAAAWLHGSEIPLQETVFGDVFQSGKTELIRPSHIHQRERLGIAPPDDFELENGVVVPIRTHDSTLGCLVILNRVKDPRGFDARDVEILELIASRMAMSIGLSQAQDEEAKAERLAAIGTMLSGVVHDLKTPLTVIGGYARMMVREPEQEKRQTHRDSIRKQIGQIQGMTQELLAFARGETQVLLRKVFVRDFFADVRELLHKDFDETGVELAIDLEYKGAAKMDPDKMLRLVFNLARNAREAMADMGGGQFRIRVFEADDQVKFAFSDTGPGIPREMEGRLFDSFATYGKQNGTGLGLAIVKKIVDEHKGSLAVDTRPGQGTTFTVGINPA
ncbi:MAG: signal transduction histidine kinase [Myxococcota bacterium]